MAENATTEESLYRFLFSINAELDSHRRFMAHYAPTLAPRFNAVDCLYPDENRLSAVIAMLLDPGGGHGQGAVFLNIFLEIVATNSKFDKNKHLKNPLEALKRICTLELGERKTNFQLEVPTNYLEKGNENRRIDILLDIDGFGLAIENKPWAIDQPRQIADYHAHLCHQHNYGSNFLLIYLSRNGDPPSNDSISENDRISQEASGHLIMLSYLQLKEWCQRCAEKCQAPRVRFFLEEFADYIELNFGGGAHMAEHQLVVDYLLKHRGDAQNLSTVFLCSQSIDPLKKTLMGELIIALAERSAQLAGNITFKPDEDMFCKYAGFEWSKREWNNLKIRFAFEYANACELIFGIACTSSDGSLVEIKQLKEELGCDGTFDPPYWHWWKHWDSPGWGNNNELWIEIYTNTLPAKIMEEMKRMVRVMDKLQSSCVWHTGV